MNKIDITYDYVWETYDKKQLSENIFLHLEEIIQKYPCSEQVSNRGGYHSPSLLHEVHLQDLISWLNQQLKNLHRELGIVDNLDLKIKNIWLNINNRSAFNVFHNHVSAPALDRITDNCIISGTYYVKVPLNSGDLIFHQSREEQTKEITNPGIVHVPEFCIKNHHNNYFNPVRSIEPKECYAYFWMSDMMHGVEPNASNESRVSISFNAGLDFAK